MDRNEMKDKFKHLTLDMMEEYLELMGEYMRNRSAMVLSSKSEQLLRAFFYRINSLIDESFEHEKNESK
jgi:hypothetical protein